VQGRADDQRELLDAESVAGHLLKSDSVFAFLAAHRSELFPEEMFADLFPSRRGRPSVAAEVMASVITMQALHGLSDNETVDAVTLDLRWKAACGLPITAAGRLAAFPVPGCLEKR
jgi:transposase